MTNTNIDIESIKFIRMNCLEMIDKANSGHPGMALGSAPMLHTLFTKVMNVSPKNPNWVNRDRFVLSSGHASSLLYTLLYLSGFGLKKEDLINFRQLGSITPGHPEIGVTNGVDASTGPLGQGIAYGVGTAIAESYMNNKFPELINHYTYVLCGDGDIQEGISREAFSIAGSLSLNKLIVIYDSNDIQLDGRVENTFTENLGLVMKANNWNYIKLADGNDTEAFLKAIKKAKKSNLPTLIEVKTIIGYGTKGQGTNKVHGAPIPHEETVELRQNLGLGAFEFPESVFEYYKKNVYDRGNRAFNKWNKLEKREEFKKFLSGKHDVDFSKMPVFASDDKQATRGSAGAVLKAISLQDEYLIGGAADISSSTKAIIDGGTFTKDNRAGRNILFGVRENAMATIANAFTMYGLKSFCSTFFSFADYLKPAMRLAGISHLPTLFIFSHDSLAVGEDGPTHQPVDQITMCRSIPNMIVFRPCDANEVKACYEIAYKQNTNPVCMVLTRQDAPIVNKEYNSELYNNVNKGAYVISKEEKHIDGILIASGSEVKLALDTKEVLKEKGFDIRVVSMPSCELFNKQSSEYKESILPSNVSRKMAIELSEGSNLDKYVGTFGKVYGLKSFGLSGKFKDLLVHFGFEKENLANEFMRLKEVDFIIKD